MRKFKKLLSVTLMASMAISLVACGTKQEEKKPAKETTQETTTEEVTEEVVEESQDGNLITNGDLSQGDTAFSLYTNGGDAEKIITEDEQMEIAINKIGMVEHGVQVYQDGFKLRQNAKYHFSCDISSTIDRDIDIRFQLNGGDYHAYYAETIPLTPETKHYECEFVMEEETDPAPRFVFNMGYIKTMEEAGINNTDVEAHSVFIDNMELLCVDDSNAVAEPEPIEIPNVKINQLGYAPDDIKTAVFANIEEDDMTFSVIDVKSGKSVYEGEMSERKYESAADERCSHGDFSDVKDKGTYKVVSGGGAESYEFTIGDDPYKDTFAQVVKMLYMQRCGQELTDEYAGSFAHPVCHAENAVIYGTSTSIDVSGGWHDAGDYGRYVVSGAKAVADLLLAYEKNPGMFNDNMGIPESGNGVSDILDEAKYELDWMLKMQASDGGVYHKVTCEMFPEIVMPEEETDQLVVCPVSNTATGDFAAVMAMAAKVYEESDADAAATYLAASKKAYSYLAAHLEDSGFVNPEEITTGEYPDPKCEDEYYWAAAQLYKTTGEPEYMASIADIVDSVKSLSSLSWADVGGYGSYAILTADGAAEENADVYKKVYDGFVGAADSLVELSEKNGYLVGKEDTYEWGSNMGIANNGMILLMADEIVPSAKYTTCAGYHLDYIYGMNATGYSFVTGTGSLCPTDTHHRPSLVIGECMPGMLVGGPDGALEDPYVSAICFDQPPAKCYVDGNQSFSCNEITVYWNSPLIYLIAAQR